MGHCKKFIFLNSETDMSKAPLFYVKLQCNMDDKSVIN